MEKERSSKQETGLKKGPWKREEDLLLTRYVETHGEGKWATVSKRCGLMRGGKSCRLRWKNYLRPNLKHGEMSEEEEDLIIRMHNLLGNRWSLIAGRLPGRTDNEIKNYWNTHLAKKFPHCCKRVSSNNSSCSNKRRKVICDSSPDPPTLCPSATQSPKNSISSRCGVASTCDKKEDVTENSNKGSSGNGDGKLGSKVYDHNTPSLPPLLESLSSIWVESLDENGSERWAWLEFPFCYFPDDISMYPSVNTTI